MHNLVKFSLLICLTISALPATAQVVPFTLQAAGSPGFEKGVKVCFVDVGSAGFTLQTTNYPTGTLLGISTTSGVGTITAGGNACATSDPPNWIITPNNALASGGGGGGGTACGTNGVAGQDCVSTGGSGAVWAQEILAAPGGAGGSGANGLPVTLLGGPGATGGFANGGAILATGGLGDDVGGGSGGAITAVGGAGGSTGGGNGGVATLNGGPGGDVGGGRGGNVDINGGQGGNTGGGNGGTVVVNGGTGGTSSGGAGGVIVNGGIPGAGQHGGTIALNGGDGSNTGGNGGTISATGGNGFTSSDTGGSVSLVGGASQGTAGSIALTTGGAFSSTSTGGNIALTALSGKVAHSPFFNSGGDIKLIAGDAPASTAVNAGHVFINSGAPNDSGLHGGSVYVTTKFPLTGGSYAGGIELGTSPASLAGTDGCSCIILVTGALGDPALVYQNSIQLQTASALFLNAGGGRGTSPNQWNLLGSIYISPGTTPDFTTFPGPTDGGYTVFDGGQATNYRTYNDGLHALTVTTSDRWVLRKVSPASTPIGWPSCTTHISGLMIGIADSGHTAAANNIVITPSAGTIDTSSTYTINTNGGAIDTICDGVNTNWVVVASH